jgi:lipid-A-disaccharide synthase
MRYYIIAGEASGDLHASNLMQEIGRLDPAADFRCWGGDRMQARGGTLVKHINELAFMGFQEVLLNLRSIIGNLRYCKMDLMAYQPDVLILVDYPGFNLRMAEFAKKNGIRVVYYISPQIWAWKQSRVKKIQRYVDKMLVILPFEKAFYNQFGVDVEFVGHPLLDALEQVQKGNTVREFREHNNIPDKPLVAILPGSRKQEISRLLHIMATVASEFPDHHFVIAGLNAYPAGFYKSFFSGLNVSIVYDQTYSLLSHAHAALVTSGTATLETALFQVPQLVCYKAGSVSYAIARRLVKVKYISLVNLIMDKLVVREFIQSRCNQNELMKELSLLLNDATYREDMKSDYALLRDKLGGGASRQAASQIIAFLGESMQS